MLKRNRKFPPFFTLTYLSRETKIPIGKTNLRLKIKDFWGIPMRQFLIVLNPDNFPSEIIKEMNLKKGDMILIQIEPIFIDDEINDEIKKALKKRGVIPL
jgi:hypothetical protein